MKRRVSIEEADPDPELSGKQKGVRMKRDPTRVGNLDLGLTASELAPSSSDDDSGCPCEQGEKPFKAGAPGPGDHDDTMTPRTRASLVRKGTKFRFDLPAGDDGSDTGKPCRSLCASSAGENSLHLK